MSERENRRIGYEPLPSSPSPCVSMAFIGVALGAMSALWASIALGFDLFWSHAILPVPPQAWILSAGVVPSAIAGVAIGARQQSSTLGRVALALSLPALLVSGFLLSLAWLSR